MFTLADFGTQRFEARLKNGIKVVLFYRPNAPIYTQALLHSGSSFDPRGKEGMAHFIEHMIVNGSARFPSKDLLSEHIESVGGMLGAATNPEVVIVNAEVPEKEDFSRAVDIFEASLCSPLLDKKVFETEKDVVIKEITKSHSNPDRVLYEATTRLLFKDTPFEHRALGTIESVSSISHDDMVLSHKELFDASRITFVASGDIRIEEMVQALDTLPFLTGMSMRKNDARIEARNQERKDSIHMDIKQTSIFMGFYSAPMFSKDALCISLAGNILASGRTGRLVKKLRYEKGLIYSVNPASYGYLPVTAYGIKTDTSEDKVQSVIDETLKVFKELYESGITEKELDFTKNKLVKSLKRSMQTSSSWVDYHSYGEALGDGTYRQIHDYANQVNEASVADVNEAIRKYMSPEGIRVTLAGKVQAADIHIK